MAGYTIEDAINKQITDLLQTPGRSRITLEFTYDAKHYMTTFNIHNSDHIANDGTPFSRKYMSNRCINTSVDKYDQLTFKFDSSRIQANRNKEQSCFTPRLETHGNGETRITSTDVLQTLKTKLTLLMINAFPNERPPPAIELQDRAEIQGVFISRFNMLRGKDAIYEKYGYVSEELPKIKHLIQNLTWGEYITNKDIHKPEYRVKEELSPLQDIFTMIAADETTSADTKVLASRLAANLDDPEVLGRNFTEIMSYIPLKNDIFNQARSVFIFGNASMQDRSLSSGIFRSLILYFYEKEEKEGRPLDVRSISKLLEDKFTLKEDSPGWKLYNERLTFVKCSIVSAEARGRNLTKNATKRRSRSRSANGRVHGGKRTCRKRS